MSPLLLQGSGVRAGWRATRRVRHQLTAVRSTRRRTPTWQPPYPASPPGAQHEAPTQLSSDLSEQTTRGAKHAAPRTAAERQARLGAQAEVGGEEPEFTSGDEGPPPVNRAITLPTKPTRGAKHAAPTQLSSDLSEQTTRRAQHAAPRTAAERQARLGAQAEVGGEEPEFTSGDEGPPPVNRAITLPSKPTRRAQHAAPRTAAERQARLGAQAEVGGEEPEFTSGDEGGWDSPPKKLRLRNT